MQTPGPVRAAATTILRVGHTAQPSCETLSANLQVCTDTPVVALFEFVACVGQGCANDGMRRAALRGGLALVSATWGLLFAACGARTDPLGERSGEGILDLLQPSLDAGLPEPAPPEVAPAPPEPMLQSSPEPIRPQPEPEPVVSVVAPRPPESAVAEDEPPVAEPLPEECRLAPVEPELDEETFEVLGDLVSEDFTPPEGERWNWAGESVLEPGWPYPSRWLWPTQVELPALPDGDFQFVAMAGSSEHDFYVVGRRGSEPLILHRIGDTWQDESNAVLAASPGATEATSVSVATAEQVWVTTPEGLLRSNGKANWDSVDVPSAVLPLGAAWLDESGFGVVAGGSVATTRDAAKDWILESRSLGFVAPGLAYSRSYVRVDGHGNETAVVGRYGHLITRDTDNWFASTLLASDVTFTEAGQFMTARGSSQGLFFQEAPGQWQIHPLSPSGGLERVWASDSGDVFAGGALNAILHRFADGTLELLPSEVSGLQDFYGDAGFLYALTSTSLWAYALGDADTSGVARAAIVDEALLDIAPSPTTNWGQAAAANFETLGCVDETISVGSPAWEGALAPDPPTERYGSCYGAERTFSETAFSFTAPTAGSYRIVLEELDDVGAVPASTLQLALRNGCEGWVIWGGGFVGNTPAVDVGLNKGQVVLVEVWANSQLEAARPFRLSIY